MYIVQVQCTLVLVVIHGKESSVTRATLICRSLESEVKDAAAPTYSRAESVRECEVNKLPLSCKVTGNCLSLCQLPKSLRVNIVERDNTLTSHT